MHRQLPAQGFPQPIEPPAQVGAVVEVVLVVLVMVVVGIAGGSEGAHSIFANKGFIVRVPNWSSFGTVGSVVFGHFTR